MDLGNPSGNTAPVRGLPLIHRSTASPALVAWPARGRSDSSSIPPVPISPSTCYSVCQHKKSRAFFLEGELILLYVKADYGLITLVRSPWTFRTLVFTADQLSVREMRVPRRYKRKPTLNSTKGWANELLDKLLRVTGNSISATGNGWIPTKPRMPNFRDDSKMMLKKGLKQSRINM